MRFRGDERGQAIQIGAVLLFGVLIISLASYQAFVVPNQNEQVEFSHNQEVQQDMQEVRNAIVSGIGGGSAQSVTVDLGVRYPSRAIAVNPGPASGNLRTAGTANGNVSLSIDNATASGEVGDFWNGDPRTYNTGALVYRPNYNVYQNAPTTVYDSTVLANQFREANRSVTGQRLIDGTTINLVTLNGSVGQASSGALSLDVRPVSASTRAVSISNTAGENITISIATRLSSDTWSNLLDEEAQVKAWSHSSAGAPDGFATLNVTLKPGDYTLRMAKMGVGTSVRGEDEAYITTVEGDGSSVQNGNNQTLVAEVRDSYNNPVSGREVNFTVDGNHLGTAVTDADGRATVQYSPSSSGSKEIEANISSSPTSAQRATFTVEVTESGSSNSNGAYGVEWLDPSGQTGVNCPNGPDGVCNIDAGQSGSVTLTMNTTPTADGASVSYAVNDTDTGFLERGSGLTNGSGENQTVFQPVSGGRLNVYTSSGSAGDTIQFDIVGTSSIERSPDATIDNVDVSPSSVTGNGNKDRTFTIDYNASDPDGNLQDGTVYLNESNTLVNSTSVTLSGAQSSGQVKLSGKFKDSDSYTVRFVARDTAGNSADDTKDGTLG
jgi:hypothetical protein